MRELFKEISQRWNRCERLLKTTERLRDEVNLPAINELRYAGRRIADCLAILVSDNLSAEDQQRAQALLRESYHFCMRAEHDCVDSVVLYVHTLIKKYDDLYDRDMLRQSCPRLAAYQAKKRQINDLIISSREEREHRDDIYQTIIADHLDDMILVAEELENAKDTLKTEYARRLKALQGIQRKSEIALWVGVVGTIVGIVGLAVALR